MLKEILSFFNLQREIFGVCPECGELFRLSDCAITKDQRPVSDWLTAIDREEERLGRIEERIEDQKLALQEAAARKGREAAVRMVRKFDPVFNPLELNPDDSRIILHPVDYLVFSGMTSKQPLRKVIVLDRETKNPEQRAVQRSIEQAVEKGRYDWQTLRVGNDGVITAE